MLATGGYFPTDRAQNGHDELDIRVYDVGAWENLLRLNLDKDLKTNVLFAKLAFSDDGSRIIATYAKTAAVWDVKSRCAAA